MSSRPLSPHLQVYRPQLTSILSITHRATGVFLSLGAFALVYWLMAVAGGAEQYQQAQACFGSLLGKLLVFGWTFSFYYHLCNGIRHLAWDTGRGFDLKTLYTTGYAVIGISLLLSIATLAYALSGGGA